MKASLSAVVLTAFVVAASALAGTHSKSRLRPESLARTEAITTYCEKNDPAALPEYRGKLAVLVAGRSEIELEQARQSDRYARAMSQANQTLQDVSDETGVRGCAEFLANTE